MCKDPILPSSPKPNPPRDLNIRFNSINMVSLRQPKLFLSILLVYFHGFFLRLHAFNFTFMASHLNFMSWIFKQNATEELKVATIWFLKILVVVVSGGRVA